jgi:hypothetical protein
MKSKIMVFVCAALIIISCGKKKFKITASDVPPAVVTSFQEKYPTATIIEWEAEKEGPDMVYEVGFKINDKKMEAAFNPDGAFIKEEK